jgi:hypothetical protein
MSVEKRKLLPVIKYAAILILGAKRVIVLANV